MKRFKFPILLSVFCSFLLLFIFPFSASVLAKDYHFPSVKISAQINDDGSVDVVENRTYSFDGSFSWATMWIPERVTRQGKTYQAKITNFNVREGRKSLLVTTSHEDNLFKARWTYSALNEQKTFTISYRILNAVTEYPDVAEFYWQLIGGEWEKPTDWVEIKVRLLQSVASRDDIKVFGHGPLSGDAEIVDEQNVRFTVAGLPARQFVEVRVLFPPDQVNAPLSSAHTLKSILDEEERFVKETIASVKRRQLVSRLILFGLLGFIPLGLIIWLILWYQTWRRVGKDYDVPDVPKYSFDLPSNLEPALVQVLLSQGGKPSPQALTATIFDLARRGFLEIDSRARVESGFLRTRTVYTNRLCLKKEPYGLKEFEAQVWEFLDRRIDSKGGWLDLDDLKKWIKKHPAGFQRWFRGWQKRVQKEGKKLGFMEKDGNRAFGRFWGLAILLALGIVNVPLLILAAVMNPYLKRRTREWEKEAQIWLALKRFLDDFSSFKKVPAEAYKLWERYLVFGILFGNAERVIKILPVILQDERAVKATWYTGIGYQGGVVNTAALNSLSGALSSFNVSLTRR